MSEIKESENLKQFQRLKKEFYSKLEQKDQQGSFDIIRKLLSYPGSPILDSMWEEILILFQILMREMGEKSLEDILAQLSENPFNVDLLYKLGYELYEKGLYQIAATFLLKANRLMPQQEFILSELAINLEMIPLNREICHILENADKALEKSSFLRYLLGFNYMMSGEIEKTENIIPRIKTSQEKDCEFYAEILEGMVNRAHILENVRSLDDRDLRGWHMVINGSILSYLSPFGLDDGMYGRFGYINDTNELIKLGIERLKLVLEELKIDVPAIISLPDRSSKIISLAASKLLKKPIKYWDEIEKEESGLYVAYDLDKINNEVAIKALSLHQLYQILWVHASCWTNPFPYSPDLTTYLYQFNASPWGRDRIFYNEQSKKTEILKPDDSPIEDLARLIIEAPVEDDFHDPVDDLMSVINPFKSFYEIGTPGIFRNSGSRIRQRVGSPVKSNRFF